jgi:hypothetical protein
MHAGFESNIHAIKKIIDKKYFVAIGNNVVTENMVISIFSKINQYPCNAIAKSSGVSSHVHLGNGIMIVLEVLLMQCQ